MMPPVQRARGLAWDWSPALFGVLCTLPAGVVVLDDVSRGLALAVGVLPAAIMGIAPRRRGRFAVVLGGILTGVPMFVGGLLSGVPVLAVAAIAALGPATAQLAQRARVGMAVMSLSLPMVGVGLSYTNAGEAAGLAALMVAGSVAACAIAMLWPERETSPPRPLPPPPALEYGVRHGAAGATAAAIGFLLDLEHVGWACAAALLVMRPVAEMQRIRSVGRIAAVAAGALAGVGLIALDPPAAVYSAAAIVAVAAAAATHGSRWYVTSAFTTFLVFLLLLHSHPQDAESRFDERLLETLLGVGIAYAFGLALPKLMRR
jgi:hypothetical protein